MEMEIWQKLASAHLPSWVFCAFSFKQPFSYEGIYFVCHTIIRRSEWFAWLTQKVILTTSTKYVIHRLKRHIVQLIIFFFSFA